jgi:AcrR family transcriptional regulator
MAKTERLSREAWITGALDALAEDGLDALAVEPLARRLGVTKGSFYWHFASRDDLLRAVLDQWEHDGVDAILREIGAQGDPRSALARMITRAFDIESIKRPRWASMRSVPTIGASWRTRASSGSTRCSSPNVRARRSATR